MTNEECKALTYYVTGWNGRAAYIIAGPFATREAANVVRDEERAKYDEDMKYDFQTYNSNSVRKNNVTWPNGATV